MRKVVFWTVTGLLTLVMLAAAVFWVRSYSASDQVIVRPGTENVSILTSDRGVMSWLLLPEQAQGSLIMFRMLANGPADDSMPRLDELCEDHALGFGTAGEVNISPLEAPAAAGVLPTFDETSWALRRVVLPFWAILALAGGTLLVWLLTVGVRLFRIERGLCPHCSYDVSESSHFCPRCRRPIPKRTWSGESRPTRRTMTGGRSL